jgi:hypothetical protein
MYPEGLAPVAPAFARARSVGPSPCGGSPASLGFACLGDTGLSAACQPAQHHCGCALCQVGIQLELGPLGARSCLTQDRAGSRDGLAAVGSPLNRPVACSPSAGGAAAGYVSGYRSSDSDAVGPGAGQNRTRSAGLEVITDRVHSGHDSVPVRAVSARPTSAEQRA